MAHAHASPALTDWTTSSINSPRIDEKSGFLTHTIETPTTPSFYPSSPPSARGAGEDFYLTSNNNSDNHHHHHHHVIRRRLTHLEKLTRYNNIFGYILTIFSVGITLVMEAIMIFVLYKFYTTNDIPAPDATPARKSPWAKGTTVWPTYVLLVGSLLTFVLDFSALVAAMCQRHSRRAKILEERLGFVALGCYVVKWIVVAALYMAGKTSKDLWGWSCDARADKIQQFYIGDLNFKQLCTEQTIASYLSWAEGATKVILFLTTSWLAYKLKKSTRNSR